MSALHVACGEHLLADLHGVAAPLLRDGAALAALLERAAAQAGARVLFGHVHAFGDGGGITGVVLLAESHISIHTWPEHGFAALDIFMCGGADPARALRVIESGLGATHCVSRSLARGAEHSAKPARPGQVA